MMVKNYTGSVVQKVLRLSVFVFSSLVLFHSPLFAQTLPNEDICAQTQCVKIQNGYIWVLSSDNVTYMPYFVKGVDYQPTPIGRYPSDWGYPVTDPRSINNNIYDDPDILNRDFPLLQQMKANTIRIWSADNMKVDCQCGNNGRFTDYMTNAGTTANADTTQNTLDIAANYGLKVIPGFTVGTLTFDINNNIGSTDSNGNPLTGQQIINNFVNFVNTYKGNRAILFWAIGNENNYQQNNPAPVAVTALQSQIGASNGSAVFNWLEQNGDVDAGGDVIGQVSTAVFQNALQAELVALGDNSSADYNLILNDLITAQGGTLTPLQLKAWYGLVDAMAKAAHTAEGATFHPVAVVNGSVAEIGNSADGATDAQLPDLDIWGATVYDGQSFGTLFSNYAASQSSKPLWIAEFGIDAYETTSTNGINNWGATAASDLGGAGYYDPADQSAWDGDLWSEILNNSPITIGGTVMEYSDEWWKPYEFYCTSPTATQAENTITAAICNSTQKYFGLPEPGAAPDSFFNEEWWGVVSISPNAAGLPDNVSPRPVYTNLQAQWQADPWPSLALNITGSGAGTITSTPAFGGGAGLDCNFSSLSSAGNCSAVFTKNQPVTLSFSSNNNSTVTNWGVSGCSGGNTCTVTPDTDIILNIMVTAPVSVQIPPTVAILSPSINSAFTAPVSITLTASAGATNAAVSKVAFYNGATLIGVAAFINNLYTYTWSNMAVGSYNLTAVVTDSNGATGISSPVPIGIFSAQTPLAVSITSPVNNASYVQGAAINLTANAGSPNGIEYVQYFSGTTWIGGASLSGSPYTYAWNFVNAGTYTITAVATDNTGLHTTSAPVTITVTAPSSPVVAITSPVNGAYVVPGAANVTIKATASSSQGTIKGVAFYAANYNGAAPQLLATVTKSPYTYQWKTIPEGTYYLTAVATDSTGAKAASASVLFLSDGIVWHGSLTTDNTVYTAPANVVLTIANLTVSNHYPDSTDGISSVAFYNGTTLLGKVTGSPYTFTWKNVPAGTYNLTAVATDSNGVKYTPAAVSITVNAVSGSTKIRNSGR